MEGEIINKVAKSGIEQIDLADFNQFGSLMSLDLEPLLWEGLVLKEKDFRSWVKSHDWTQYADKNVHVYCSNDAIVPAWAYMLITTQLKNASAVFYGDEKAAKEYLFMENLNNASFDHLIDKRVMVKGCSTVPNPNQAFVTLTRRLTPLVKSLMFGEPCSAVPVYKKPK
jgi:hypothetical protein